MAAGPVDRHDLQARIKAAQALVEANLDRLEESRSRLSATIEESALARSQRQQLHSSAFARLQARLDSLPVIEQAKGVLMAQAGCPPDEAFDILRRASQRTNIKVRELAADIVERASNGGARPSPYGPSFRPDT
jgi:AmiR/NasT family two-component response regulator